MPRYQPNGLAVAYRQLDFGDTMTRQNGPRPTPPEERYERFVVRSVDGCWGWRGATTNGYGTLRVGSLKDGTRTTMAASRLSYQKHAGPIPDGLWVLHKCDNPPCTRPDHLFLGTKADNDRDREQKGRTVVMAPRTHCYRGHEMTPDNVYTHRRTGGGILRLCRTCSMARNRRWRAMRKAAHIDRARLSEWR